MILKSCSILTKFFNNKEILFKAKMQNVDEYKPYSLMQKILAEFIAVTILTFVGK